MDYSEAAASLAPSLEQFFPAYTVDNLGTFLPQFIGDIIGGAYTFVNREGFYTRIGNVVTFAAYINISAIVVAPTGSLFVTMPLVAGTTEVVQGALSLSFYGGITLTAGYTQLGVYASPGSNRAPLLQSGSGVAAANIAASALALIGGVANIGYGGSYRVN